MDEEQKRQDRAAREEMKKRLDNDNEGFVVLHAAPGMQPGVLITGKATPEFLAMAAIKLNALASRYLPT